MTFGSDINVVMACSDKDGNEILTGDDINGKMGKRQTWKEDDKPCTVSEFNLDELFLMNPGMHLNHCN